MDTRLHDVNTIEQLRHGFFKRLFVRGVRVYCQTVSWRWRMVIEAGVAVKAVLGVLLLLYIHTKYVVFPTTCVSDVFKQLPDDSILRIEVRPTTSSTHNIKCREIPDDCNGMWIEMWGTCDTLRVRGMCQSMGGGADVDVERRNGRKSVDVLTRDDGHVFVQGERGMLNGSNMSNRSGQSDFVFNDWQTLVPIDASFDHCHPLLVAMEYSKEYGYLRLSNKLRMKHNVTVWQVQLDPDKNPCFRGGFAQWILANVVGYDDMFMISFKHIVGNGTTNGYLRNELTGRSYKFVDMENVWQEIFVALTLMVIFTVLVTLVLRQVHTQVFNFIINVYQTIELNTPIRFPFAFVFTILLAVIGLENAMTEFFTDGSLSFWIILMIWCADHFHSICCQSRIGKKYWWRFFYLYQFMFYCYYYIFNGQFSGIALVVCMLLVEHSMLFFLHHYEIPIHLRSYNHRRNHQTTMGAHFPHYPFNVDRGGNRWTPSSSHVDSRRETQGEDFRHRAAGGREGAADDRL